jgi:iron complex outermembrane recepter protein
MAMPHSPSLPNQAQRSAVRLTPLASAIASGLLCFGVAQAQVAPSSATEPQLMGVQTVSQSRLGESRSELAATVQVIDNEALSTQIKAGSNLKEALGHLVPGIDLGNQGRSGFGQNLRGRPMLVMIDGVSLNSSRGTARQLDSIDPFHIERIEVLSGASSLYGGGATGGIVNLITRKAADAPSRFTSELGLTSGLNASDDRQLRVAQSISGGNETVQGRLGIAVQDNGRFFDSQGKALRSDITQTDLQDTRSIDAMGNLQFNLGQGQNLDLSAQYYRNKFEGSSYLYAGTNFAGIYGKQPQLLEQREGFSSDVVPMTERAMLNANYHARDVLGGHDFYLQGFWRQEELDFAPFPASYVSASHQNTAVWGLKAALAKQIGDVSVRYGLDWDREDFDSSMTLFDSRQAMASGGLINRKIGSTGRYPDYRVDSKAVFGQMDWKLSDRTTLSAGLRHQRMGLEVQDFVAATQQVYMALGSGKTADVVPGGNADYNVTLFNLGAHFKPLEGHSTWLNYSEGFELPDPGKYFGDGKYTLQGTHWQLNQGIDPNSAPLKGIKTRQVEWGWKGQQGPLSFQTALFYAWSDNSIELNRNTLLIDVLEKKRRNYGWEGSLNYALNRQWGIGGSWLLMQSQERKSNAWQRQGIDMASPSKLTLHTDYQHGDWKARLQATHQRTLKDDNQQAIKGFTTVDLMGSTQLGKGLVSFGIQNLLDRRYLTTWSQRAAYIYGASATPETFAFYGRGRTFSVGYTVNY